MSETVKALALLVEVAPLAAVIVLHAAISLFGDISLVRRG